VIHLVADIHQPLHCANNNDRGGNDCVFHAISITDSTAIRSPIPAQFDHPFHGNPISDSTANRSLVM